MLKMIFIAASLIAAFIAGIAALFAPCCITVLLPAYFGSIFRQARTVVMMTFVFFLGLLAVFLPIGIGIAAIGNMFSRYHDSIFIFGGIFLLLLGISILLGIHLSLPFSRHPKIKVKNAGSVFILGIFSAFATLCCAPVLAGVLALSALPGSVFWGSMYSVFYVLGMVAPLFVIAYFIDKKDMTHKFAFFQKKFKYNLLGKQASITGADIISGITFIFMGILILYLSKTGKIAMGANGYQTSINIFLKNTTNSINNFLSSNTIIFAIFVILIFSAIIFAFIKHKKTR